jgi:hypothetical protein
MSFQKLLSADAAEFIPSALVIPAAAATAAPAGVPLTFAVYRGPGAAPTRTFALRPMTEPRTGPLKRSVLYWIGKQVRGYEHPFVFTEDETIEQGCHDNDYRIESIVRPMPGVDAAPLGDFPNNIQDYFWLNDGKNDEHPWYMLARLDNGTFVFLAASCNYSGFECTGQIVVYAATDLQALYDNGMPEAARFRFACCFDKGTREKVTLDKKERAAVAAAARRPKVQQVPAHLRQTTKVQQARMLQAQQALQARYAADRERIAAEAQAQTAHAAAFKILDERVKRWQAMSDSDHEREEERMEAHRDRMRDQHERY